MISIIPFGKTNKYTSRVGLGLAALGRPGYINLGHGDDLNNDYQIEHMQQRCVDMLDLAYEKGIRYFDAARSYGKAEQFLNKWIGAHPEQQAVIGSKWGYEYTAEWNVTAEHHEIKNHNLQLLKKQWGESVDLLHDHLDIYHIHSATLSSAVLNNEEVIEQLWNIKNEGVIVGLSLSGTQQADTLEKALEIQRDGVHLFQSVQATYNILERSAAKMLQEAKYQGWGVIIKEVFANGRLTSRNSDPAFESSKQKLQFIAQKHNVNIDAIAMAFVLSQPWVSVALSGATTKEMLESNLQGVGLQLDLMDFQMLDEIQEEAEVYWETRSELEWN
ncbi:aldo/keto reductase [Flammeovirga yaeyamensis]|uniref:Aldo/keto reductase n=1 Tax=Flammeovirga yaeyamensis TaxID=367791 RepID=A0AAX1N757_9BACT|nr:aldo/keto reductase [Flammeovirga yaeyamensis]MBB3697879.1 aryl-alcohol dehydrogenase-like predicted oxidoreductase [Flammeovirga yaeyamensis]NMF35766.1 aldo/keto reductase [Flammeovirga yaeyamensis]QWG03282.1 aldo/keto reductase [Flammeovirga yaeyamensis]